MKGDQDTVTGIPKGHQKAGNSHPLPSHPSLFPGVIISPQMSGHQSSSPSSYLTPTSSPSSNSVSNWFFSVPNATTIIFGPLQPSFRITERCPKSITNAIFVSSSPLDGCETTETVQIQMATTEKTEALSLECCGITGLPRAKRPQ